VENGLSIHIYGKTTKRNEEHAMSNKKFFSGLINRKSLAEPGQAKIENRKSKIENGWAGGARGGWMTNALMNLLVDYYPEVQFRPYGSGCTRENTLPWLKKLKLGYLCVYAKGHSGYTTWPSSLKTSHNMLSRDMPKFFREITRAAGTKLILYYSGLLNGIAGQRHPEWRMLKIDGSFVTYYHEQYNHLLAGGWAICPLSGFFDEWVAVELRELITNYDPDGIWVDGDWMGPCFCPRCQARFRRETGWKGPWRKMQKRADFKAEYAKTWNQITHEWRARYSCYINPK
jgi:hypothetical protein